MGFRAHIAESPGDWAQNTVKLLLLDDVRHAVLMETGVWQEVNEGERLPDAAGITIPRGAIYPLADAIASWRGQPSHEPSEAAVLREWLVIERNRVDSILDLMRKAAGGG